MWPTTGTWAFCGNAGIRATPQIAKCRLLPCNQGKHAHEHAESWWISHLGGFWTWQGLGAQDTAPVFLVAEIEVTDLEGYIKL